MRAYRPSRFGDLDVREESVECFKAANIIAYARLIEEGLQLFEPPDKNHHGNDAALDVSSSPAGGS